MLLTVKIIQSCFGSWTSFVMSSMTFFGKLIAFGNTSSEYWAMTISTITWF